MKKKPLILIVVFLIAIILLYFIINAFFYNSLSFKSFALINESNTNTNTKFILTDDEKIIYHTSNDGQINNLNIKKIQSDNISPVNLISFTIEQDKLNDINLVKDNSNYILSFNSSKDFYVIDSSDLSYTYYSNPSANLFFYNSYTKNGYSFQNSTLTNLINDQTLIIDSSISQIKNIEFYSENKAIISTYNNDLYDYSFENNTYIKFDEKVFTHQIYDNYLYYVYTINNKMGISKVSLTSNDTSSFEIDAISYNSLKIKDDYIYFISNEYIYKISISRQKKHETLKIGAYANSIFDLSNIMICNEKLMYLPMVKVEYDYTNNLDIYKTYIYRYKV